MSDEGLVKELFQYGLPTVLLIAFCYGAWRILWAIGSCLYQPVQDVFAAAKVFLEKNVTFLSKMEVLGDGLLKQQEAQTELMKLHDERLLSHGTKIDEIHKAIVKP